MHGGRGVASTVSRRMLQRSTRAAGIRDLPYPVLPLSWSSIRLIHRSHGRLRAAYLRRAFHRRGSGPAVEVTQEVGMKNAVPASVTRHGDRSEHEQGQGNIAERRTRDACVDTLGRVRSRCTAPIEQPVRLHTVPSWTDPSFHHPSPAFDPPPGLKSTLGRGPRTSSLMTQPLTRGPPSSSMRPASPQLGA